MDAVVLGTPTAFAVRAPTGGTLTKSGRMRSQTSRQRVPPAFVRRAAAFPGPDRIWLDMFGTADFGSATSECGSTGCCPLASVVRPVPGICLGGPTLGVSARSVRPCTGLKARPTLAAPSPTLVEFVPDLVDVPSHSVDIAQHWPDLTQIWSVISFVNEITNKGDESNTATQTRRRVTMVSNACQSSTNSISKHNMCALEFSIPVRTGVTVMVFVSMVWTRRIQILTQRSVLATFPREPTHVTNTDG